MTKGPPETLDPTTIPPLWGSMAPGGYRTPPYTLGWRLTPQQLQAFLDPGCTKPTIPVNLEIRYIAPRWGAFGYANKYRWVVFQGSAVAANYPVIGQQRLHG